VQTILGSEILSCPLVPGDKEVKLPSPSALKGKILIKSGFVVAADLDLVVNNISKILNSRRSEKTRKLNINSNGLLQTLPKPKVI